MRRVQDNPGSVKDAVKDIMIAGTGLVDMINNWKHQPWLPGPGKWVSLMIPCPQTPCVLPAFAKITDTIIAEQNIKWQHTTDRALHLLLRGLEIDSNFPRDITRG